MACGNNALLEKPSRGLTIRGWDDNVVGHFGAARAAGTAAPITIFGDVGQQSRKVPEPLPVVPSTPLNVAFNTPAAAVTSTVIEQVAHPYAY